VRLRLRSQKACYGFGSAAIPNMIGFWANQSFEQMPDHLRGILSSPRPVLLNPVLACDTMSHSLSVLRYLPGVPGMFLPVPTQACYRRADDGVRSPVDNVPNRVQLVTGEPLGESSPVKD
jgi:hypothetical protein